VAEQNMAGCAAGLSARGKKPFVSTFAAFLTRAFDQIRMANYADANINFCGSHAGVSIGQDGPSQMGLEDIAMFRTLTGSCSRSLRSVFMLFLRFGRQLLCSV
jgi:transketolase